MAACHFPPNRAFYRYPDGCLYEYDYTGGGIPCTVELEHAPLSQSYSMSLDRPYMRSKKEISLTHAYKRICAHKHTYTAHTHTEKHRRVISYSDTDTDTHSHADYH